MKVLLITGNPKKKGALATITGEAARGATEGGAEVEEIRLADRNIGHCKFCMTCFKDIESEIGPCSQQDDMSWILEKIREADGYILASQVSSGHVNAIFKTFFERSVYTAGKSTGSMLGVKGVPEARLTDKKRYAVTLVTAGSVPSWLRMFNNIATKQLAEISRLGFNAKVIGKLYAGALTYKGLGEKDKSTAYELGKFLAEKINRGS